VADLLAGMVLVASLVACGTGAAPSPGGGTADTATFVFGWVVEPASLDPHAETSIGARQYWYPLYDTLFDLGTGTPEPGLATALTVSPDGLTASLAIRDGVTFRDGTPFDASAAKASLERARTQPTGLAKADLAVVSSIEVADPRTVTLRLTRSTPELATVLGGAAGAMINPKAIADGRDLGLAPGAGVGTTPYDLLEFVAGQKASYGRVDGRQDWRGGRDALARLEIIGLPDERTLLSGVQSGQLDGALVRAVSSAREAERSGLQVATYTTNGVESLMLRNTRGALKDPAVRQAISHAIDREAISTGFFEGDCPASDRLFPEGTPLYAANARLYPTDPARARELLVGVGPVAIDVYTNGTAPGKELAEILQGQLAEVGVTVSVVQMPGAESQAAFVAGDADARQQVPVMPPHPIQALDQYLMPGGRWNGAGPEAESSGLVAARARMADPTLTEEGRAQASADAGRIIEEQAWMVPICRTNRHVITKPGIVGADRLPYVVWSNVAADLLGLSSTAA
jgi:peptide/nickel transport system substrate-binding protein